jgi:hypothetical protein
LKELATFAPSDEMVKKNQAAYEELGFLLAAIAEAAIAKAPEADQGAKTRQAWIGHAAQTRDLALEFVASLKKPPAQVKQAAANVASICTLCHGIFKD